LNSTSGLLQRLHIDPWLLLGIVILCVIGIAVLYSGSGQDQQVLLRQGVKVSLGFALMVLVAQISPQRLQRWTIWMYIAGIVLLVAVGVVGVGQGAQRWLDLGFLRFQPSEMMKIAVPLMVAWFLSEQPLPPSLSRITIGFVLIAIPVGLVAEQPDLGTAFLIAASGAIVLFLAGIGWRYLIGAAVLVLVSLPLFWLTMHDYQRERISTLIDPESDPLGAGYHIIQSRIAVGSGGLYGKGWLNGTQSRLEFIPERSTDFIFAVYCEEFGFIGVVVLLAAYLFVIARGLFITVQAQDIFGRLVAGSLTLVFFVYIFVNMGMVIGQLPVVGVPLPFISSGGTFLVTLMTGFGILMSVHTHRRLLINP
jgi:rod shape determining protein RodA